MIVQVLIKVILYFYNTIYIIKKTALDGKNRRKSKFE